jgi:uncharacterized tellurite resistance protein B-like protein
MLMDLLRRLGADTAPAPLDAEDWLARQDDSYSARERAMIDRVLAERYGLGSDAAGTLRAEAEAIETEAPDTVRFTRMIKEAVPYDERQGVVEALWRVAIVDGIDAEEHGFLRLVASLLGVSDVDSGLARQRAADRSSRS